MSTRKFKTVIKQLLDLMIHSLYSNRDIFLRELVANAADAIDKARFEALTKPELNREWQIRIELDKDAKTLVVSDNGIGMNEEEIVENLGTIAKSGTKAFAEALSSGSAGTDIPELIGQFGVGFYSAFMVANKVEVTSKRLGEKVAAVKWVSTGEESYEISQADKPDTGTQVKLYLKDDAAEYLDSWRISEIVHKYSDYIAYPIVMAKESTKEDGSKEIKDEVLNSQKAIWLRPASEITEEDHQSFFAHLSGGGKYWKALPISAEGTNEFKALLYIPEKMPYNFLFPEFQKKGLQLYVKRVFITDECEQLIPDYLNFVKGVVDSSDLPLNVSREILQENPLLGRIRKAITSKVLSELKKLQEKERDNYVRFFKEFGKILKIGLYNDFSNQDKLKELAMYESLNGDAGAMISLAEYVSAMPETQEDIYYITAESRSKALASPALEVYRSKGYDVLIMTDPIDEWVMQVLTQYDKKLLKSVAKGDLELDAESRKSLEAEAEQAGKDYAELVNYIKEELSEHVSEVRFSGRLTESPCCLVAEENGLNARMEKFLKSMNQDLPESKRILELNAKHPLIKLLAEELKDAASGEKLKDNIRLLYDQAVLNEGGEIEDLAGFSRRLSALMVAANSK